MPDTPRRARRAPQPRTQPAESRDAPRNGTPLVVAGLLRGQPEAALLAKAVAGMARIRQVDDRFALVSTLLASRPSAVVLPPFDKDRTSMAPLVFRVRREAPGVAVLLLSIHPQGAGQPILRAGQLGARVMTSPTAAELRAELSSLLQPRSAEQ
jgi:hypothetical protein